MAIQDKVKKLPHSPGVYIFKDKDAKIIYIGKAKDLRRRVQSYFNRALDPKTQVLVSNICDLDFMIMPSEMDAVLAEAHLIKENLPKYNVSLRDDKSFPLIKISADKYPIISVCRLRERTKDKAMYFGPYTDAALLRQAIKTIRQVFGFRTCRKLPKRACLYYRLNLCPAPCIGAITARGYKEVIKEITLFLEGRRDELIDKLAGKMNDLSKEKRFEEAAIIRDKIAHLTFAKKSKVIEYTCELENLRYALNLSFLPVRIEAFDISNISGQQACGSLVYFLNGAPHKDNYRRFRIKTVERIDDYAMIREVVNRRYRRVMEENLQKPDLILIDGGRGHLLTAEGELNKMGIKIPVISIAKEKENIYIQGRLAPIRLPFNSKALHLLQRIRNEAHRFAVSYHRLLRRKKTLGR